MEKKMVMDNFFGKMEENIKDNGKMDNRMEKVNTCQKKVLKN